jgi:hypothetical protein
MSQQFLCSLCGRIFYHNYDEHQYHYEDQYSTDNNKHICETCVRQITEAKEIGYSYKTIIKMVKYRLDLFDITEILKLIK